MQSEDLFAKVISMLRKEGVLEDLVLTGSWAFAMYARLFKGSAISPLRTRDIDFLIKPVIRKTPVDLPRRMESLNFISDRAGEKGYVRFINPELNVEFISNLKGRDFNKPREIKNWKINAQELRYLSILEENTMQMKYQRILLNIPTPEAFIVQKTLILDRRQALKRNKDIRQIRQLSELVDHKNIIKILDSILPSWKKTYISHRNKYILS